MISMAINSIRVQLEFCLVHYNNCILDPSFTWPHAYFKMTALDSVCMSRSVPGELRKDSHFKIYSVKKTGIQRDEEEEKPAGDKHKLQQQPTNEDMMCRNIEHSLLVLNYGL